ncbi:MAG: phosphoribosyl-ATP diphosphatase [Anaerolineaceae bacterium]|nr:phosphoribosyl-ATP diphosphatase [Anaerolineaceae bacterium]
MMNWPKKRLEKALSPARDRQLADLPDAEEKEDLKMDSTAPLEQEKFHTNLPTIEELLNPLLHTMHSLGGPVSKQEIEEKVVQQENITEKQLSVLTKSRSGKTGQPLFSFRLGFARTYLKDYGILENPAPGTWSLTDLGKQTFHVNPKEVRRAYDKQRRIRKAERDAKNEMKKLEEIEEQKEDKSISDFLINLESILHQRRRQRPEGSYTAELFAAGPARIAQKLGEESLEVIIAALHESREHQIAEAADLLFHLLILLVELEIPLEEILSELQRRHETRAQ